FDLGGAAIHPWQVKMAVLLVPVATYGLLILGQAFPRTERVAAGVSTGDMWREGLRPGFLLLVFCMLCTAGTELGPNQWVSEIVKKTLPGMAAAGILVLVWISLVMCVGRFFAGPLAHAISPIGIVLSSAFVSGIGLLLLSYSTTTVTAFGAATVFALGVCFFWPTMLGITSERFPKGGALLLAVMGAAGNVSTALVNPIMGGIIEATGEYAAALRYVVVLPAILVLIFGGMFISDLRRGGYKVVKLGEPE
ncbi:MAG: sugar MFS transporter, partial [Armatimonadota bacterium]